MDRRSALAGSIASSETGGSAIGLRAPTRTQTGAQIVWRREYEGVGAAGFGDVAQGPDGGLLAVGQTESASADCCEKGALFAVGTDGSERGSEVVGTDANDYLDAVTGVEDGYRVAGKWNATARGDAEAWYLHVSPDATVDWNLEFGTGGADALLDLVPAGDGAVGVGYAKGELWVVKLAENGSIDWDETVDGPFASSLARTGNAVVAAGSDDEDRPFAIRLTLDGDIGWQRSYEPEGVEEAGARDVAPDGQDGATLVVDKEDTTGVLNLAPDGSIRWRRTYDELSDPQSILARDSGYTVLGRRDGATTILELDTQGRAKRSIVLADLPDAVSVTTVDDDYVLVGGTESEPETGWVARVRPADGGGSTPGTTDGSSNTKYALRDGDVTEVTTRAESAGGDTHTYYVINKIPGTTKGVRRAVTTPDYELVEDPATIRDALWVANYVESPVVPDVSMWRDLQEYSRNRRDWLDFTATANRFTEVLVNLGEIAILLKTLDAKSAIGAVVDGLTDVITWGQTALEKPYEESFTRMATASKNLEWIESQDTGPGTAGFTRGMEQFAEVMAGVYGQVETLSSVADVWSTAFSRQGYNIVYDGISLSALDDAARGMAIGLALSAATAPLEDWFRANAQIDGILSALHAVRLPIIERIVEFEEKIANQAISPAALYRYHVYRFTHYQVTALGSAFVAKKYEAMDGVYGRLQAADSLKSQHVDRMQTNSQLAALAATGLGATRRDVDRWLENSINAERLGGVGQ
jgi:hypothetical protein